MTGPTTQVSGGSTRSEANEPWDERPSSVVTTPNNNNNEANMRGYNDQEEEELEDGDLPRLNLSRSVSNGGKDNPLVGRNASHLSQKSIHHENLQKMAGGSEELKKQQAFWKQLDTASTKTSFEEDDADGKANSGKKKRFDKSKMMESQPTTEDREDTKVKQGPASRKKGTNVDGDIRRAESEESDDTRDSKEYYQAENEDNNYFCDNTLSAMEAICGDSGLQAFCGGPPNGASNPPVRRKKAKNLNILNARGENDSVDEHTAIEVEYVEPEETNGLYQEKPENWSPSRKNAYLAAMARKAKEDFEKSQTKEIQPASPRRQVFVSEEESAAQDVYNSFNPAEKRKFLRLINSGMTPTESAERVRAEQEKSKETKPSKKGKLFKFWKKGKSKTEKPTEKESKVSPLPSPSDRDQAGFPLQNNYLQEEKKDDDQLTAGNAAAQPRLQEPQRDNASQSTRSSSDKSGEGSQDSHSKSQSPSKASSADDNHRSSGSEGTTSSPRKAENQESGGSSRDSTTDSSLVRANTRAQEEKVQLSPERPKPVSPPVDVSSPVASPRNLSTSFDNSPTRSPFDGGFAKSGINYYDAVRRDVSESEDETEFSNQVSITSKGSRLNKGPRLGPILHSPKLKGFSKLSKNGFKDDQNVSEDVSRKLELQLRTERPTEEGQVESQAQVPNTSSQSSTHSGNFVYPNQKAQLPRKEQTCPLGEIPKKDFPPAADAKEYGTANFDIPVKNSNSTVNSESNTPSKAEEEALERIEKELLRPVRNGDGSIPIKTKEYSSAQTTTPRGPKSADRLRDQIVAVVSPEGVVSPMTQASSLRTPPEKSSSSMHAESSPSPRPVDASLFQASPMADMPAVIKPSPVTSSQHGPKEPAKAKGPSLEPTQEDLDFGMQEYLNSTEASWQAGHVNDSMSIVSGKSYTTHDTSMYGGSVYTQGSSLTQSSRKRRPGAAKTRLAKAKEAERQALKKKGWHESIQAAAESTNRVWKPNVGWVDYSETSMESNAADLSSISNEKMHLNLPVVKAAKQQQGSATSQPTKSAQETAGAQHKQPFVEDEEDEKQAVPTTPAHKEYSTEQGSPSFEPGTPSNEAPTQRETETSHKSERQRPPSKGAAVQTEISSATLDESFLAVPPPPPTTNHATNTRDPTWYQPEPPSPQNQVANTESSKQAPKPLSLDDMSIEESIAHSVDQFVKSVAATSPTRSSRMKPSASPNSRSPSRANRFASPSKRTGWVDSMRAATANIDKEGKSWDPVHGWNVEASEPLQLSVNEDFSPPSTRFGQETIEERQGEASDRFDPARIDYTGPEPADGSELDQDDDQSDVEESDDKMLDSDGAFPVERFSTTTVHVIKEKVDEEEMHWFPPTRRSSSMVVIAEDPNENASSAASASSKIRGSHAGDDDAPDGVIWDGVVFETGSFSPSRPKPSREKIASNTYVAAGNTNNAAAKVSNTEVSKSGSSVSSKSSFSKTVPRLTKNKRDTSPIRRSNQKVEPRSERDASQGVARAADQNPATHEASAIREGGDRQQSGPDTWKSSGSEKSSTISEGEQARAKRSVWRSAASPSNSPRRRGNEDNQAAGFDAAARDNRTSMPTGRTEVENEDSFASQTTRYYTSSSDYRVERAAEAGPYSPYGSTPADQQDSEPFAESSNVRARAQFWESRTPSRDPENDAEEPRHSDHPNSLNSATAEWKSFLGKKVRAESVAAAGQHGNQVDLSDARGRSFGDKSDSLFDFSVDSRGLNHHDARGVRFSQGQTEQHLYHAEEEDSVDASKADRNAAPSEISEYSDGNEINKPFLQRLAGCAAPMMAKRNQASDTLAHLSFLRTNGNDGNQSRFMPHLCGRPEVILEEAEEKKLPEKNEMGRELSHEKSKAIQSKGNEVRADTRSVISEDFGAKTAYLEALAMKTAVSKPRRSSSRGRERSSAASDVSSASSKLEQKERWRNLLEKKSRAGASPAKSRASESEAIAAKKVDEMLASMMASRSKSAPRSRRVADDLVGGRSRFPEREQANEGQYKSESLVAAEQLASVRLNAMMEALAHGGNAGMEEGEI